MLKYAAPIFAKDYQRVSKNVHKSGLPVSRYDTNRHILADEMARIYNIYIWKDGSLDRAIHQREMDFQADCGHKNRNQEKSATFSNNFCFVMAVKEVPRLVHDTSQLCPHGLDAEKNTEKLLHSILDVLS